MSSDVKTPYLNVRQRTIYKSGRGAYFVKDASGKKIYGVKARYVAVVNGTARKLTSKNATPPAKIAPKLTMAPKVRTSTRKVRSNVGKKRGAYKPRAAKIPVRNALAIKLSRYLNANSPNLMALSNKNLASINQAAKLAKIVLGNGQGWRLVKGSSAGSYKNVSEGSPMKVSRSNILRMVHNYGQGNSNKNVNRYIKEFREETPNYFWM